MKIQRNAPCPCGSGKKYKQCHLGKPLPGETGSVEAKAVKVAGNKRAMLRLAIVGLLVSVAVGYFHETYSGIVTGAGWILASAAYLSFRDPPPPNPDAGDPAALNFGR